MQNDIQKYEPMKQITMKDGRILLFPAIKHKDFMAKTRVDLLINVEGIEINKYEIKYIEDLAQDHDILIGQPQDIRQEALNRFSLYEERLGKKPNRNQKILLLQKVIAKIKSSTKQQK